jgi:predicted kinase
MSHGILLLSGPPCSGKSAVGRVLAAETPPSQPGKIHIEVDALFALLLPNSDRSREDRMLAYDAAHLLARLCLQRDAAVALECTYARQEQRSSLLKALADLPAPLRVVEFFVTPDEAVRRFRQRRQATDLDESQVRERTASFPYFDQALRLASSAASPAEHARRVTEWLAAKPRPVDQDSWAQAGRAWD